VKPGPLEDGTSLFVRGLPPERGFPVGAGLESVLDFLSGFRIDSEDIDAFAAMPHRPPARRRDTLLGLEFTGQVRAVPDGRRAHTAGADISSSALAPSALARSHSSRCGSGIRPEGSA
jgi:nicotinic acid phosphoribosyltransferase